MIKSEPGTLATANISEGVDNRQYKAFSTASSTSFTPVGGAIYYPMSGNVEFIAYYPYRANLTDFKLPIDVGTASQSSQPDIDVLYAPKTGGSYNKSTTSPVALAFRHKLVKLAFTIGKDAGVTESLNGLTVNITGQKTAADLDLTNGTVTPTGAASAITANTAANGLSSEAIVLPNGSVAGMTFTFTTAAGGIYEVAVPTPTTTSGWEPGYKYAYAVTLKRNEASITGSVSDWNDGGAYNVTGTPQAFSIEGYAGEVEVTYTESEPVTIASITLTDYSNKTYLIGRVADTGNPVHLKFDGSGELLFRDPDADGFIPIGSYAEFQKIISSAQNNYRLEADLDLMEEDWTPIQDNGFSFGGEFDGAGKEISNLKITGYGTDGYDKGLFRENSGTIRNVHIVSGEIKAEGIIGGICGRNQTSGQIISCTNAATVSGTGYFGGIVGNNSGTVTACYNTGVVSGGDPVGGVMGYNEGAVTACYNTGAVEGSGDYVGGVVGWNNYDTVTACYWESTTATNGIGGGTVDGVTPFTLPDEFNPDYFNPTGTHEAWNTGTGGTNGWWKAGTTDGSQLPRLWFE
jgi:hypothetical protein